MLEQSRNYKGLPTLFKTETTLESHPGSRIPQKFINFSLDIVMFPSPPFNRHQTSFLFRDGIGCFLYRNIFSVGLLQGSWFPTGKMKEGAIFSHLRRTEYQAIAKTGPQLVESLRGQILFVSGQQRETWLMTTIEMPVNLHLHVLSEVSGVGLG